MKETFMSVSQKTEWLIAMQQAKGSLLCKWKIFCYVI